MAPSTGSTGGPPGSSAGSSPQPGFPRPTAVATCRCPPRVRPVAPLGPHRFGSPSIPIPPRTPCGRLLPAGSSSARPRPRPHRRLPFSRSWELKCRVWLAPMSSSTPSMRIPASSMAAMVTLPGSADRLTTRTKPSCRGWEAEGNNDTREMRADSSFASASGDSAMVQESATRKRPNHFSAVPCSHLVLMYATVVMVQIHALHTPAQSLFRRDSYFTHEQSWANPSLKSNVRGGLQRGDCLSLAQRQCRRTNTAWRWPERLGLLGFRCPTHELALNVVVAVRDGAEPVKTTFDEDLDKKQLVSDAQESGLQRCEMWEMVPGERLELSHGCPYQILSLARLPISPPRQRVPAATGAGRRILPPRPGSA